MDQVKTNVSLIKFTKSSVYLISGLFVILFLIGYIWWPLLDEYIRYFDPHIPVWQQVDFLLLGNFLVMSILIMFNADLKQDIPFILISLAGGFIIEFWGTSSGLWQYYTFEVPPLWIIPAWPIAALSVKRISYIFNRLIPKFSKNSLLFLYYLIYGLFLILLLGFVWPMPAHPLTFLAVILCGFLIITEENKQISLVILLTGSVLGYFLERWGTTRLCWTYYTGGTPPLFTVFAHGMASVAVWRVFKLYQFLISSSKNHWAKLLIS